MVVRPFSHPTFHSRGNIHTQYVSIKSKQENFEKKKYENTLSFCSDNKTNSCFCRLFGRNFTEPDKNLYLVRCAHFPNFEFELQWIWVDDHANKYITGAVFSSNLTQTGPDRSWSIEHWTKRKTSTKKQLNWRCRQKNRTFYSFFK